MHIRTNFSGRDDLTPGKLYKATRITKHLVEIMDDFGDLLVCAIGVPCSHLQYRAEWEIVDLSPDEWER